MYHISDYSCNIFLFILHNILYTGNEFEPISITIIFLLKISYKLNQSSLLKKPMWDPTQNPSQDPMQDAIRESVQIPMGISDREPMQIPAQVSTEEPMQEPCAMDYMTIQVFCTVSYMGSYMASYMVFTWVPTWCPVRDLTWVPTQHLTWFLHMGFRMVSCKPCSSDCRLIDKFFPMQAHKLFQVPIQEPTWCPAWVRSSKFSVEQRVYLLNCFGIQKIAAVRLQTNFK